RHADFWCRPRPCKHGPRCNQCLRGTLSSRSRARRYARCWHVRVTADACSVCGAQPTQKPCCAASLVVAGGTGVTLAAVESVSSAEPPPPLQRVPSARSLVAVLIDDSNSPGGVRASIVDVPATPFNTPHELAASCGGVWAVFVDFASPDAAAGYA